MITLYTVFGLNIVCWSLIITCQLAVHAYVFASANRFPFTNNCQEVKQRLYQRILGTNEYGRSVSNPHWVAYPWFILCTVTTMATFWLFTYIMFLL
jgi:CHASE1-domain containing sensor protein